MIGKRTKFDVEGGRSLELETYKDEVLSNDDCDLESYCNREYVQVISCMIYIQDFFLCLFY